MEKENQIQKNESMSPNQMIKLAIEGNADLEKLEKLLGLQIQWEANEARKAYASEFAIVQANIESVIKTKLNPQTHSKYAALENVLEIAKPVYTKQGFSVIFSERESSMADHIRLCADVLHKAGHKETYHMDLPLDGVGIKGNVNMTKMHGKASSVSYGRRYLLCMIWNIPTKDEDAQGIGGITKPEPIKVTTKAKGVIAAVAEILKQPDSEIDHEKLGKHICNLNNGKYPENIKNAKKIADALIASGLRAEAWSLEASPPEASQPEASPPVNKPPAIHEMLDTIFWAFNTEHQNYLDDNPDRTFNKRKFKNALIKLNDGELPETLDKAYDLMKLVFPKDVEIIVTDSTFLGE